MARTQNIMVLSLGLIAGLHTHCLSMPLLATLVVVPSGAPYGPYSCLPLTRLQWLLPQSLYIVAVEK